MLVTDDVLGVVSLAEQGLGLCQTYDFIAAERIRRGRLVEMRDHTRSRPFSVLYAPHRRSSAASWAFIEALTGSEPEAVS